MALLVSGASGFIGRNLLQALPVDEEIVALYCSAQDFPDFVAAADLGNVKPVRVDLTQGDCVKTSLRPYGDFEAVFNLAANGDPTISVDRPAYDLRCNVLSIVNLLEACGTGHFIHMSSGAVYDGLQGSVGPGTHIAPRLPYAIGKMTAEHYLQFFHKEQKRVERLTILRFFGAFGPLEPARKIYTRLVQSFAMDMTRQFVVRGTGKNLIDAMYVDDAVAGLLKVWNSSGSGGLFDFSSGEPLTIDDLVRRAAATFGVHDLEIEHRGTTAEPINFTVDSRPFNRRYSFTRHCTLEAGLHRLHDFLQLNN